MAAAKLRNGFTRTVQVVCAKVYQGTKESEKKPEGKQEETQRESTPGRGNIRKATFVPVFEDHDTPGVSILTRNENTKKPKENQAEKSRQATSGIENKDYKETFSPIFENRDTPAAFSVLKEDAVRALLLEMSKTINRRDVVKESNPLHEIVNMLMVKDDNGKAKKDTSTLSYNGEDGDENPLDWWTNGLPGEEEGGKLPISAPSYTIDGNADGVRDWGNEVTEEKVPSTSTKDKKKKEEQGEDEECITSRDSNNDGVDGEEDALD